MSPKSKKETNTTQFDALLSEICSQKEVRERIKQLENLNTAGNNMVSMQSSIVTEIKRD